MTLPHEKLKCWTCKIGEVPSYCIQDGGDMPMRLAVMRAYKEITGHNPKFVFSGWGGELDAEERAVVDGQED